MADDWRDRFSSRSLPGTFAHPGSPAGGTGNGYSRPPGPLRSSALSARGIPYPDSPSYKQFAWELEVAVLDRSERVRAVLEASAKAVRYVPKALYEATGQEIYEMVRGIAPALLLFMAGLAVTTAFGAAVGAAIGFFAGGVGAAPGAVIGAEAGLDIGVLLLNYLGLFFLVDYIAKGLVRAHSAARSAVRMAWYSADRPALAQILIDRAAHKLAFSLGLVFRGVLQGVVAYLLAKGTAAAASRVPELVGKLKASKLGAGFAEWVEKNWSRLLKNPKLRPEGEGTTGGKPKGETPPGLREDSQTYKTGEESPTAEKTVPTREQQLQELAKDPAQGGRVTPKSLQEAEVGLSSVESGKIPGPITRDPSGAAEFIDAEGTSWDVKGFNSKFPPEKGGFDLTRDLGKVQSEIDRGESVIVDTSKMSAEHIAALRDGVSAQGLNDSVVWYP